ncbi:MAG: hypothetical protein ACE5EG_13020, partial [Thermoanaerobaculia bacterium]
MPAEPGSKSTSAARYFGEERLLVGRLEIGLARLAHAVVHQLPQRVGHLGHALGAAGLQRRRDLEGLALADQVGDGRGADEDLESGDA